METDLVSCPRTVLAGAAAVVVVLAAVWDLGRQWVIPKKQTLCGLRNLPKNGHMPHFTGDSVAWQYFCRPLAPSSPAAGYECHQVSRRLYNTKGVLFNQYP